MKFTEKLGAHITPEWRMQYLSYADLKNMLLTVTENAPSHTVLSARIVEVYYANFEEEFFFECEKELRKVDTFYAEKLAEAMRKNEVISTNLDVFVAEFRLKKQTQSRYSLGAAKFEKIRKTKKTTERLINELRNAYSELYLSLVLLQNYKVLNYTGFRKILKKHDKLLNNNRGMAWFDDHLPNAKFHKDNVLENIIEEVETNVTQYLEGGDRAQAMKRLRVPPLDEVQQIGTVFRVGYFVGAFTVLMALIFLQSNAPKFQGEILKYDFLLFRGTFFIIFYLFLLGINVYCWSRFGINHILIFEIDPRKRLTFTHVLELHGIFGIIWTLSVIGYLYADDIKISRYWFPLTIWVLMLSFLFLVALPIFNKNGEAWLLKLMGRVFCAPFFPVGFADFWFGDQLNSMTIALNDIKYLCCFYALNSKFSDDFDPKVCREHDYIGNLIVLCLPAWFRFAQCLRRFSETKLVHPFLINAAKYLSSFPKVVFSILMVYYQDYYKNLFDNPYVWAYLVASTVQAVFCCSWDVLRDFGLFKKFSGPHIFLRDHIIYPKSFYYFAIIENFILRFFWVIQFYTVYIMHFDGVIVETAAEALEITRRYIWNYIRLENEHLFNVGNFRAVRDIYISPIVESNVSKSMERLVADDGAKKKLKKKITKLKFEDSE